MQSVLLDFSGSQSLEVRQTTSSKILTDVLARWTKPSTRIPTVTDLTHFSDESLVCLVDGDNWDFSLKTIGFRVRYDRLLMRLRDVARRVVPVAVITSNPGDHRREDALNHFGWRVISIPRETVSTCDGERRVGNADADLCYELGFITSVTEYTAALIGTGDGNLAVSCSLGLKRSCGNRAIAVHTLSVVGATSARLRTRRDLFASSALLGMDFLETINR